MINIMKNICKILFKRKSFIITTIILPIVLIFVFALLYGGNSSFKVGIINNDEGFLGKDLKSKIEKIDAVEVIDINKDENYLTNLVFHKYEIILTIDKNFTKDIINGKGSNVKVKAISMGEMESIMELIINSQIKSYDELYKNILSKDIEPEEILRTFNEGKPNYEIINNKKIKTSINTSLGVIIYLIFVSAGMSCGFLLEDEKQGTKARIFMANIHEKTYFGAVITIFFLLSSITSVEYYIVCNILGYNFGFENKWILLLLMLLVTLLAVVFNIMLTSIIKNKSTLTLISTSILVPVFMLSGAFWSFDFMGKTLQKVGNALPIRWFLLAVEKLQMGQNIESIFPIILALVLLTIFLFFLSIFFTRNKIVLIKEYQ
ncbi:MAG: ABC transporter permease [Clostridium sp.]|jgi:ABC-2 type transporter|nr:ABC transporter permease [Clostridium sp.]